MTQSTPILGANLSGLTYRTQDNNAKRALLNHHKGSTAPTYAEAGMIWMDDSETPWLLKVHDGSDWIVMGEVNSVTNTFTPYFGTAAIRYLNHAADTGSADTYIVAPSPAITAYVMGQVVTLKPANGNTGTSTLAVSDLPAKTIKTLTGANLSAGMLDANGVYLLIYDGTNFVLLNDSGVTSIALGGTGATTAAGARTNLGLAIGSNVQAYDANTAKTNVAQGYTKTQNFTATTLTDASTIAWDSSNNQVCTVTLGGNRTLGNPSNKVAGATYVLIVKQDATGGRTLAYNAVYKFPNGVTPVLSTTANAVDILTFVTDGTNMYGVCQKAFS